MSITFVGFKVTKNGDLIDPTHGKVLEKAIITPKLYTGLKANKVNFDEDYRRWQKGVMIEKIARVMGKNSLYDPDKSYVLTVDNLIKILAILMRFRSVSLCTVTVLWIVTAFFSLTHTCRCGIPVVIMGETGCGKTRLIRYMCDLARQGIERNNMLIMKVTQYTVLFKFQHIITWFHVIVWQYCNHVKLVHLACMQTKVHGGITEDDITRFVEKAEKESKINSQHQLDTVVFFDEANTTDAIGLIKEIMCDHRLNGRPISKELKFIAACNPYRK